MKRRRKKFKPNYLIVLSAIVMLNFAGVSYASWNNNLNITASVSTGSIEPGFSGTVMFDGSGVPVTGSASTMRSYTPMALSGSLYGGSSVDEGSAVNFNTQLYPGENATIMFNTTNSGSIPIKLDRVNTSVTGDSDDGITVNMQQAPDDTIDDNSYSPNTSVININALKPGTYRYNVELDYKQFNK